MNQTKNFRFMIFGLIIIFISYGINHKNKTKVNALRTQVNPISNLKSYTQGKYKETNPSIKDEFLEKGINLLQFKKKNF